jgi:predicted nucleic acid-binding protein
LKGKPSASEFLQAERKKEREREEKGGITPGMPMHRSHTGKEVMVRTKVEGLFEAAESRTARLFISVISLGEVFYSTWKSDGEQQARLRLQQIVGSPIQIGIADLFATIRAAEPKAKYRCAHADAIAASLTMSRRATLVTSDPDFKRFADRIKVLWLLNSKSAR